MKQASNAYSKTFMFISSEVRNLLGILIVGLDGDGPLRKIFLLEKFHFYFLALQRWWMTTFRPTTPAGDSKLSGTNRWKWWLFRLLVTIQRVSGYSHVLLTCWQLSEWLQEQELWLPSRRTPSVVSAAISSLCRNSNFEYKLLQLVTWWNLSTLSGWMLGVNCYYFRVTGTHHHPLPVIRGHCYLICLY